MYIPIYIYRRRESFHSSQEPGIYSLLLNSRGTEWGLPVGILVRSFTAKGNAATQHFFGPR